MDCRATADSGHQLFIFQLRDSFSFTKATPDSYIVLPILKDRQ